MYTSLTLDNRADGGTKISTSTYHQRPGPQEHLTSEERQDHSEPSVPNDGAEEAATFLYRSWRAREEVDVVELTE
jgi:hypothetical protein